MVFSVQPRRSYDILKINEMTEMEISINQEISFKLKIYFLIKYEESYEKLYIM